MFVELTFYTLPHWIKYKVDSLSSGMFCRWDKIAISSYKNNLTNLVFACESGDIYANSHVDAFLNKVRLKIILSEVLNFYFTSAQLFDSLLFNSKTTLLFLYLSHTEGYFTFVCELFIKLIRPFVGFRLFHGNCFFQQRMIEVRFKRRAIIIKNSIQSVPVSIIY